MNYFVIANPWARNGRGRKTIEALNVELRRGGLHYNLVYCDGMDHACELSRQANQSGEYDVIVGVGGDGTINRVLNGFFDAGGHRLSRARFGVVHIGTSPDFCKSYGVPVEMEAAVNNLARGLSRPISVGRLSCGPSLEGVQSTAYFACCANIGLGASLARAANGGIRKYAGDFCGTLISLFRVLTVFRPCDLEMEMDGNKRTIQRVWNVSVGKTCHIASGIQVHHELRGQDRRFYVLIVQNLNWLRLLPVLRAIYSGRPMRNGKCLTLDYAQTVSFGRRGGVEVEMDGDPAGVCPCKIETACDSLDLITPIEHD